MGFLGTSSMGFARRWLALPAACLLVGCAAAPAPPSNGNGADTSEGSAELAESVMQLDEMIGMLVDGTANSLTFRPDAALDQIGVGDVVMSANPAAPFLRRVTGRVVDNDGRITFRTENVGIEELFSEANVSAYGQFLEFIPADGVEVNSQTLSAKTLGGPGAKIIPIANLDLTLKLTDHRGEGSANVKVSLSTLLEIERPSTFSLSRLKTSVIADYEFGIGLSLKLAELFKKEFVIGEYRVIYWIGVVPVYTKIQLYVEVTGELKAAVSVAFKGHIESGAEWTDSGGWRQVYSNDPLVGEGKAQGEVGVTALFKTRALLYALAGPDVGFGPAFTASINSLDPCAVEYELGIKVDAAFDFAKVFEDDALKEKGFGYEFKREITKGKFKLCEADKPDAPTNLTAARVGTETKVTLSWKDNATNEARFLIRWNDGGGWRDIAYVGANATGYVHALPSPGLDNLYEVYAVGSEGTLSDPSNLAGVTLENLNPPPAPSGLAAKAEGSSVINLSWTHNSADESGFFIHRKIEGGGFEPYMNVDADVTGFADHGVEPDQAYAYRVQAYSPAGTSGFSNVAEARTSHFDLAASAPAAPGNLKASAVSASEIVVTWDDNSSVEEAILLERAEGSGGWGAAAELGKNAESYSDSGLSADTSYSYRVRARNAEGDSGYSNIATARTDPDGDSPPDNSNDNDNSNGNDNGNDNSSPAGPEYVVWFTGNVCCWGAPWIFITTREDFESPRLRSSFSGGGIDPEILAVKVEIQGGFTTAEDASAWICPQFVSRFNHYWCGSGYAQRDGANWWPSGSLGCDIDSLPLIESEAVPEVDGCAGY